MSKILDGIVKLIASKINPYRYECKNVYFRAYIASTKDKRDEYITYVDREFDMIHSDFVSDCVNLASKHISIGDVYTREDIENYILYLMVCHLNDQYYNRSYQYHSSCIYVRSKISADTYCGFVVDKDKQVNVGLKPKNTELEYINNINKILSDGMKNGYPMPYCIETDLFIGVERCTPLNRNDPYLEVIKDVVNQMKSFKSYKFRYLCADDIGRSSLGMRRYFIYNFDSITMNDGQYRQQLMDILVSLNEFFTSGKQLSAKISECVSFLNSREDDQKIYEDFILYLLTIK